MIRPGEIDTGPSAGPVRVFLHGFLGAPGDWAEVIRGFGPGTRCLALWLPGHGPDPEPVGPVAGAFARTAEGFDRRLAALGVARAGVVGYSMGGRLALAWAVLAGGRVGRLALVGASPGLEDPAERARRAAQDEERAADLEARGLAAFLDDWYAQPLFADLVRRPGFAHVLTRRAKGRPLALAAALRALGTGRQPPLGQALAARRDRALLVAGARDTPYAALGAAWAARGPGLTAVTIPDAGHSPHLETPDALREVLQAFFRAP